MGLSWVVVVLGCSLPYVVVVLGGGWLFWVMILLLGVDLPVGMENVGGLWWPRLEC